MNIAGNIRRLRLENDMTQEKLARAVGVVTQTVSKWERDEGLPDVSLLPALAAALNCSADTLLGLDEELAEKRRKEILQCAAKLCFSDPEGFNPESAEEYMRAQLQRHPNDWQLWYQLGQYLIYGTRLDSDKPNMAKLNEALEIYERIRLRAPTIALRTTGVWGEAIAYNSAGDYKRAKEIADELPTANLAYEGIAPVVLRGEELREFLKAELLANIFRAGSCIQQLAEGFSVMDKPVTDHLDAPEARIDLFELQARLYEQLEDIEWAALWSERAALAMMKAAGICMESGDKERAMDYVERAAAYGRPKAGEKPGRHAVHNGHGMVYNGETENIVSSREAAALVLMLMGYAREFENNALASLVNEPRWQTIEDELKKYVG